MGADDDEDVELPGPQTLEQTRDLVEAEDDRHLRVALEQRAQRRHEEVTGDGRERADRHATLHLLLGLSDPFTDVLGTGHEVEALDLQPAPEVGKLEVPSDLLEQSDSQVGFERSQPVRDRWLGPSQVPRRVRHGTRACNLVEGLKKDEVGGIQFIHIVNVFYRKNLFF